MNSPTKSSIVLVAGSALDDFPAVMNKIDSLAEDMLMIPYAIVVFVHNTSMVLNTTRHHTSPPVVSKYKIYTKLFIKKIEDFPIASKGVREDGRKIILSLPFIFVLLGVKETSN